MANAGFKAEQKVMEKIANAGDSISFQKLDGSLATFSVDKIFHYGHTTRSKVDISISPAVRLQVKSTSSNRASVVNMVPFRNLEKVGKREMLDIAPILETISKLQVVGGGTQKLATLANIEDWREFLEYFLFEGTATGQADKFFQATHLLEVDGSDWILVEKQEAVDYIWKSLTIEIRTRSGKNEPCLHVRYGK